jgi:hypothetical protein
MLHLVLQADASSTINLDREGPPSVFPRKIRLDARIIEPGFSFSQQKKTQGSGHVSAERHRSEARPWAAKVQS